MIFFGKKQILLIGKMVFVLASVCHGNLAPDHEARLGEWEKKTSSFKTLRRLIDQVVAPFSQNAVCYSECTQKKGRQGAEALQAFFRQQGNHPPATVMALLEGPARMPVSDTERQAREAISCLKKCRAPFTLRFLAQFLGTLETEEAVRASAIVLGAVSYEGQYRIDPKKVVQGIGEDTKLFQIIFNKGFSRGCLRVLRHEPQKQKQFRKNMDLLNLMFFSMYGPVHLAPDYIKSYGVR